MILGIDVGNTNIVAALLDNGTVAKKLRYPTAKNENYIYHQKHLDELVCKQAVDGIIISSVVPEINACLTMACEEQFKIAPVFVNASMNTGLDIQYDNPLKLGADLIAAAVGAVKKYGAPVIIADIGTATTFSVVNEKNEYLGGMIAPGPYTSMKALSQNASQLPEIELEPTDKVIGTNTADCMRIGLLTAHSAMIDGMLERVMNEFGCFDLKIVATGGFSKVIASMCKQKMICDYDLIFNGLYELFIINS